ENASVAVHVVQEQLERAHALLEPAANVAPVLRGNHPRENVEGEDLLGAAIVRVDGKSHAPREQCAIHSAYPRRTSAADLRPSTSIARWKAGRGTPSEANSSS